MIAVNNHKLTIEMHGVTVSVQDIKEETLQQIADLCEAEIQNRYYLGLSKEEAEELEAV